MFKRIVIAGSIFGFPNGQGATSRISQYADGLSSAGVDVNILCLKPTDSGFNQTASNSSSGVYRGARFEYTSGTSIYAGSKIKRYWQNIKGVFGAVRSINKLKSDGGLDVLLLYGTDSPLYTLIMWALAKYAGAVFVGENTEAPFVYCPNNFSTQVKKIINKNVTYKLFDGFVVISTYLEGIYRKALSSSTPILRVPILVNTSDFIASSEQDFSEANKYVIYCGNLTQAGELESVLDVWRRVEASFQNVKLMVIGNNSSKSRFESILNLLRSWGIEHRVEFTGLVPRQNLIKFLSKGCAMVLPRASGTFSEAGLPNKLGEYLATGKPTIVTANGDIKHYLSDGVSALLVTPGNLEEFAQRLSFALNNEDDAKKLGLNGRLVAQAHFDTHVNCKKLTAFFNELIANKEK